MRRKSGWRAHERRCRGEELGMGQEMGNEGTETGGGQGARVGG